MSYGELALPGSHGALPSADLENIVVIIFSFL
jgi:hypothetical protein